MDLINGFGRASPGFGSNPPIGSGELEGCYKNSAVPYASFHLAHMDFVTCTNLPCFLHLFKLSVYLNLASTSQVALMLTPKLHPMRNISIKKGNSYSYKYKINVKIINNDIYKEILVEFPLYWQQSNLIKQTY